MKKTTIYLTNMESRALDFLSRETELNKSEIIRRAIDEYLERVLEHHGYSETKITGNFSLRPSF